MQSKPSHDWKMFRICENGMEFKVDGLKWASEFLTPMNVAAELQVWQMENGIEAPTGTSWRVREIQLQAYHKRLRPKVRELVEAACQKAKGLGRDVKISDLA